MTNKNVNYLKKSLKKTPYIYHMALNILNIIK